MMGRERWGDGGRAEAIFILLGGVALSRRFLGPWSHPRNLVPKAAHKKSGKGSLPLERWTLDAGAG